MSDEPQEGTEPEAPEAEAVEAEVVEPEAVEPEETVVEPESTPEPEPEAEPWVPPIPIADEPAQSFSAAAPQPTDRPELLVAGAFVGGMLAATILKRMGRS